MVNTAIDTALFLALYGQLGVTPANFLSTTAGMTFSFLVNGRFTFRAGPARMRQALLFLAATGSTMWLLQPVVIHVVLALGGPALLAKLAAIAICLVFNFTAYRLVVWPRALVQGAAVGA